MISFIHTADVHFGMENYGRVDPLTGIHTRLLDFDRAFNSCIDTALLHNVDFFLFAGDAYKTSHPTPTQQRLFIKALMRLYKANIPVVIIVGNHDNPLSFGKAHSLELFAELPLDGFYVISKPDTIKLETKNGPVNIVGIPWPTRNSVALNSTLSSASAITQYITEGVSAIISHIAAQLDQNIPAVLAGHLTVSSGIFSGSEKRAVYGTDPLFLPSQLAIPPFDYVALGHLHRYQNVNPAGYPPVIYSGSIERIDFGERKEDKGFCLVKLISKGNTQHEFIKTPTRPFIQIDINLVSAENQTEQIIQELNNYDLTQAVVKILYHLPAGVADKVDIVKVQRACAHAFYLVGIFPVRTFEPRVQRAKLTSTMDLQTLLATYFDTKPHYKQYKKVLLETALTLAQKTHVPEDET